MKRKLQISISKTPRPAGVVSCRVWNVRERFLRFLFGDKKRITVLIPGDSVDELAICDHREGGQNGQTGTAC